MLLTERFKLEIQSHVLALQGWCTPEKAWRLAELILDNRLQWAVEVGIFGGRSIIPMALAMREQNYGRVYGLDPWDVAHATEGENGDEQTKWWTTQVDLKSIRTGFEAHVLRHGLLEWLHWFPVGSIEGEGLFQDGWANLVHVDSNHSELTSCRDIRLWSRKLAPDGFLVFDDLDWPSQQRAIAILKSELGFELIEDYGSWGVFRRPSRRPDPIVYAATNEIIGVQTPDQSV
jgi:hypothetical protein